jgi:hypothetical protein
MSTRVFGGAACVLLVTTAFATTPIGDVVKNRDVFANQTVTIEGTVTTRSITYAADALYDLQGSDDYRITIVGKGSAPAPGTKLVVTGTVRRKPPDEEFDFPPVIHEAVRTAQ